MIIVRLLISEPVGWFGTTNSTRAWEPTLSWNQLHSKWPGQKATSIKSCPFEQFAPD
jgi:hypothetical protein